MGQGASSSDGVAADRVWKDRIDNAAREGRDYLNLSYCEFGKHEGQMEYLCEFLKENQTVKSLILNDNKIGDEGMRYLAEGLKVNQSVERLNLEWNPYSDNGLQHLTAGIRVNTTLRYAKLFSSLHTSTDATFAFHTVLVDKPARKAAREEYLAQAASRLVKSAAKR